VLGLSVGFASFIILSELKTYRCHKNAERTCGLSKNAEGKVVILVLAVKHAPKTFWSSHQIVNEFSDVEGLTRIVLHTQFEQAKITVDQDKFLSILIKENA